MRNGWEDFKRNFPWKDMIIGFFIPKAMLFTGISLKMLFPGALLAVCWCLAVFWRTQARTRTVNIYAVLALVMILVRVIVILASSSAALYLLAQALDNAFYGIAFLLSLLFPRPVIQLFAESSGVKVPEAIRASVYYCRAWRIITAVWGAAFLLTAVILIMLKFSSLKIAAIIDIFSSWPLMVILIIFTVWFPRWYWARKLGAASLA